MKQLQLYGWLIWMLAGANALAAPGVDSARLAVLENSLDQYVQDGRLAGGVLYVSRHGETVLHKAFGWQDRERSIPMNTRSLHRIASQTKAFTSVAIMLLQERGALLISDPLSKYFPEWRDVKVAVADSDADLGYRLEAATRPINIRDLLTHSAGINYGWGVAQAAWQEADILGWYFAGDRESMRDKVRRMATLPQAAHPGSEFVYGYNTDILGALVEHLSGQTLGAFLRQQLFAPLRMRDTYFFVPPEQQARLSTVYAMTKDGLKRQPTADIATANPGNFYFGQGHYLQGQIGGPRSYSGGAGAVSIIQLSRPNRFFQPTHQPCQLRVRLAVQTFEQQRGIVLVDKCHGGLLKRVARGSQECIDTVEGEDTGVPLVQNVLVEYGNG